MSNSNKVLIIICIVSVAINLATVVTLGFKWFSGSRDREPFRHRPIERRVMMHHEVFARELGLTNEQIAQLGAIRKEIGDVMQPVQHEIMLRRNALMDLLKQPNPDTMKAAELISEISALQAEHERRSFQGFLKIRSILTPEQQGKMEAILNIFIEQCPMMDRPCPAPPEPPPGPRR